MKRQSFFHWYNYIIIYNSHLKFDATLSRFIDENFLTSKLFDSSISLTRTFLSFLDDTSSNIEIMNLSAILCCTHDWKYVISTNRGTKNQLISCQGLRQFRFLLPSEKPLSRSNLDKQTKFVISFPSFEVTTRLQLLLGTL